MIEEKCETCDFWKEVDGKHGACRRFPPNPFPIMQQPRIIGQKANPNPGQICIFPAIGKDNWCGEWRCNNVKEERNA